MVITFAAASSVLVLLQHRSKILQIVSFTLLRAFESRITPLASTAIGEYEQPIMTLTVSVLCMVTCMPRLGSSYTVFYCHWFCKCNSFNGIECLTRIVYNFHFSTFNHSRDLIAKCPSRYFKLFLQIQT
jgi:hypothetical protein